MRRRDSRSRTFLLFVAQRISLADSSRRSQRRLRRLSFVPAQSKCVSTSLPLLFVRLASAYPEAVRIAELVVRAYDPITINPKYYIERYTTRQTLQQ